MTRNPLLDTVAILVRHAHADWTPDENRSLSTAGYAAAAALAERLRHLPVDALYASPAARARQTVEPIAAARGLPVHIVDDLRERVLGAGPFDDWLAAVRAVWDDADFAWLGGESNRVAQGRGVAALERILALHAGQHVVIGTHGNLLALILQHYDPSVDFAFWRSLTMPDAYRLRFGANGIQYSRIGSQDGTASELPST